MALHREHVEQTQQEWLARVARERYNLSVSVEKTLHDTQGRDEEDGMGNHSGHTIYGKTLIPPRISLQSRVAPAIYRSNLGLEPEFTRTNVPVMTIGEDGELKPPSETNLLSRFARCVTSSLAAIRLHKRTGTRSEDSTSNDTPLTPMPSLQELDFPEMPTSTLGAVKPMPMLSNTGKRKAAKDVTDHITLPPLEHILDTPWQESFKPLASPVGGFSSSMGNVASSMGSVATSQSGRSKSRLAGRTTKVRLEAAIPASHSGAMASVGSLPVSSSTGARLPVAGARRQKEAVDISGPIPAITRSQERLAAISSMAVSPGELPNTPNMLHASTYLAAIQTKTDKHVAVRSNGGTGTFESTQRDVTVFNPNVSATSVVLVTLTSDPGPVVVHFVSLQPRVGFTVHLTAPASKKTSFNYVIL